MRQSFSEFSADPLQQISQFLLLPHPVQLRIEDSSSAVSWFTPCLEGKQTRKLPRGRFWEKEEQSVHLRGQLWAWRRTQCQIERFAFLGKLPSLEDTCLRQAQQLEWLRLWVQAGRQRASQAVFFKIKSRAEDFHGNILPRNAPTEPHRGVRVELREEETSHWSPLPSSPLRLASAPSERGMRT